MAKVEQDKGRIRAALAALMREKAAEQVTTKELIGLCGVPRSTFYTRYHGVLDVLEDLERTLLAELHLYDSADGADPVASMEAWIRRCLAHAELLGPVVGDHGEPYFERRLRAQVERDIREMMGDDSLGRDPREGYVTAMMSNAYVGIMLHALRMRGRPGEADPYLVANMMNTIRVGYHAQVATVPRPTDERLYGSG